MKKYMQFFKDQINQSFNKEDSSKGSNKDGDESIIAGESQEQEEQEDIDSRYLDWQQAIMGVVEISLCLGPVYFNVKRLNINMLKASEYLSDEENIDNIANMF